MGEVAAPNPSPSAPDQTKSRETLWIGVIGAAAALIGSLIGGVTSVAVANSAYENQKAQQTAQFNEAALSESRSQRLSAYKAWLQNEEPVLGSVGLTSDCL